MTGACGPHNLGGSATRSHQIVLEPGQTEGDGDGAQAAYATLRRDLGLAPSLTQLVSPYYKHVGARNAGSLSQTGCRAPIA